jgi:uncharacterized protein (TIGR03435 family)
LKILSEGSTCPRGFCRKLLHIAASTAIVAAVLNSAMGQGPAHAPSQAQAAPTLSSALPEWETAAGSKMEFEVAAVRPSSPDDGTNANFPLGPGDVYATTGGLFRVNGYPLITYIMFAYKITRSQVKYLSSGLPDWVKSDRFSIEARSENMNPTKDQMRLMVRSMLADRFKLRVHRETKQVPVYALVLAEPGKLGPMLQAHTADSVCSSSPTGQPTSDPEAPEMTGKFPTTCGGIVGAKSSAPGRISFGARNVTMALIATSLAGQVTGVDRPISDRTRLSGKYDFAIEFSPDPSVVPPGSNFKPDASGTPFMVALKGQLGLKLEPQKGPLEVVIVDHVEHPSEN